VKIIASDTTARASMTLPARIGDMAGRRGVAISGIGIGYVVRFLGESDRTEKMNLNQSSSEGKEIIHLSDQCICHDIFQAFQEGKGGLYTP
jgi:hypothetical protein